MEKSWKITILQRIKNLLYIDLKQYPLNLTLVREQELVLEEVQDFAFRRSSTFVHFLKEVIWTVPKLKSQSRIGVKPECRVSTKMLHILKQTYVWPFSVISIIGTVISKAPGTMSWNYYCSRCPDDVAIVARTKTGVLWFS